MAKKVSVYSFEKYDITAGRNVTCPAKGTLEAIKGAGGAVIEGTEEAVDESSLDGNGFYKAP